MMLLDKLSHSGGVAEELSSLVYYGISIWFVLTLLKFINVVALDFNLLPLRMLSDYVITAAVVVGVAFGVEMAENKLKIDLDKWSRSEQITALSIAGVFYPILFAVGIWGSMLPIGFTFQGMSAMLSGMFTTIGITVLAGIAGIKISENV